MTPRICENLFKRIESANSESSALCFKTLIRLALLGLEKINKFYSILFIYFFSYLEIYNEKCRDLLEIDSQRPTNLSPQSNTSLKPVHTLKVREHPTKGIFVQNLNQYNVTDLKSTMRHLHKGNQNRLVI